MKKEIKVGMIIVAIVIIIVDLTFIDYGNLNWSKNQPTFSGIIAMICLIIGMIIQISHDKERQGKLSDNWG